MSKNMVSLYTPCFNEEGSIEELYQRIVLTMQNVGYDFEWIVSDNKSTDDSRLILRRIADRDERVKLIFNTRNFGPGRSGAYGFFQTSGVASVCLAADLQDPPELIPAFIDKWEKGYKVVLGQVARSEESKLMFTIRGLYYKIMKKLSPNSEHERVTGFGLYDHEVVDLLRREQNPDPNFRFSVTNFGYDIGFIEYIQPKRHAGKSSYNFWRRLDTAIASLIQTSYRPVRLITLMGCFASLVSFVVATVLVFLCIMSYSQAVFAGALASILLFFMSLLALAIGLVGEYVVVVLKRVVNEPLVFEEDRINFKHGDSHEDVIEN